MQQTQILLRNQKYFPISLPYNNRPVVFLYEYFPKLLKTITTTKREISKKQRKCNKYLSVFEFTNKIQNDFLVFPS